MNELKGYELSKAWFEYAFEHPGTVKPVHTALYFYIVDHWNRLGKKPSFGLPTDVAMEAVGISNYKTYKSALVKIIDFGFVTVDAWSKNQYAATVVALVKNAKAKPKQSQSNYLGTALSTDQSNWGGTASIDKPITIEPITYNNSVKKEGESENVLKVGGEKFIGTAFQLLQSDGTYNIQLNSIKKMYADIPIEVFAESFNTRYNMTGFTNKEHVIRAINSTFNQLNYERTKGKNKPNHSTERTENLHSGGRQQF
jgi:hypothetical protein